MLRGERKCLHREKGTGGKNSGLGRDETKHRQKKRKYRIFKREKQKKRNEKNMRKNVEE